jgi:hypothetical protein
MGMFDSIYISSNLLPISLEEKEQIPPGTEWQTKDLDRLLDTYHITDKRQIIKVEVEYEPSKEMDCLTSFHILPTGDVKKVHMNLFPFTGFLAFYTSIKGQWYEFEAEINNGYLVDIKKIK